MRNSQRSLSLARIDGQRNHGRLATLMVNGRVFAYQDVGNGPVQQIPWFARADRLVHDDGALHEGVDVTGVVVGARRREHSLYRDVRIHPVNVGGRSRLRVEEDVMAHAPEREAHRLTRFTVREDGPNVSEELAVIVRGSGGGGGDEIPP